MEDPEVEIFLNYTQWADNVIFELLKSISDDQISLDHGSNTGSIRQRLIHLAEEYLAWYYDINKIDWRQDVENISTLSNRELMDFIQSYHSKWSEFMKNDNRLTFTLEEDNVETKLTRFQLIFNLANHATYHRGQIVTLLRKLDQKVPITDYYWFLIDQTTDQ
ncbi:MAG: hypothetical protein IH840_03805 [Candidatus Heimdallarchaeota archaeon]|nr:hypothetical protein [Candidatus Heimdallarchaeota archaeon]